MTCRCRTCTTERVKIVKQIKRGRPADVPKLEAKVRRLQNEIHAKFFALPVELQAQIFKYATIKDWANFSNVRKQNRFLLLGSVCSSWRAVAWRTPLLWQSLSIYIFQKNPRVIKMLAYEWIKRSAPMVGLEIRLYSHHHPGESQDYDKEIASLVEVVNLCSDRWGTLSLEIPLHYAQRVRCDLPRPPMLTHLKLHRTEFGIEQRPPAEENSDANRALVEPILGYLPNPWSNIRRLDVSLLLNGRDIGQFLHIPSEAPALEELCVDGIRPSRHWKLPLTMNRRMRQTRLRTLKLKRLPSDSVHALLALAEFPNLRDLILEEVMFPPTRVFTSFIYHCSTSLRFLNLHVAFRPGNLQPGEADVFVHILKATPFLNSLFLTCHSIEALDPRMLLKNLARPTTVDKEGQPFLPYLQTLQLSFTRKPRWSWADVPSIFGAAQDNYSFWKLGDRKFLPSQRPLQFLCMRVYANETMAEDVIDPQTLQRLSDIARKRRVQFAFDLNSLTVPRRQDAPRRIDLLQSSAKAHGWVWDRYLRDPHRR